MKKVFLDELPHSKSGRQILWRDCVGYKVKGIYDGLNFEVEIIDYVRSDNNKRNKITIKYKDNTYDIDPVTFMKGSLGEVLGINTKEFKIEIGTRFKDEKRDITIIDRKKDGKWKYYRYKCNKCGFDGGIHYKNQIHKEELWIVEYSLLSGNGCSACCPNPQIVVEGINDIPTTNPEVVKYFVGGYVEAKKYNKSSDKKVKVICPDCKRIKKEMKQVKQIVRSNSIGCLCGDGFSYPSKIVLNILEKFRIDFKSEYSPQWLNKKRYDFYFELNNEKFVIEVNGSQHYEEDQLNMVGARTLKEEQENDKIKKELALQNGVKEENYIVLDCRKSEIDWIKDNPNGILNSRLNEIFDLSKIDWNEIHKKSLNNFVKICCDYYNTGLNPREISLIVNLERSTVWGYIRKGDKIGWCDYKPKENHKKAMKKLAEKRTNPIICISDRTLFKSANECESLSTDKFNTRLYGYRVRNSCVSNKPYKGYQFKYIKDLTPEEYIKYDIENKLKELVQAC